MRTRSADDDLVVVDLDDPDELATRGPGAQRLHFEDHYAELPFGLGTVARRLEPDPWYTRPGVLLWVAIALLGLLALAGTDDGPAVDGGRPFPATLPTLDATTGTRLAFFHVDSWFVVDVDRRRLTPEQDIGAPRTDIRPILRAEPTQFEGLAGPLVVHEDDGDTVITDRGLALATGARVVVWRPTRCGEGCPVKATRLPAARTSILAVYRGAAQPIAAVVSPTDDTVAMLEYDGTGPYVVRMFRTDGRALASARLGWVQPLLTWSRDARWLFAAVDTGLVAIDVRSGETSRVDVTLPPYEQVFTG